MRKILVAADTPQSLTQGLSVAADLRRCFDARVSVAYAPGIGRGFRPLSGEDAIGMLTDVLHMPDDPRGCVSTFRRAEAAPDWTPVSRLLKKSPVPVDDCWVADPGNRLEQLAANVSRSEADLVLAAGCPMLGDGLLGRTSVPVWLLKESDHRGPRLPLKRILCAAKATQAIALSNALAEQTGAQLEFVRMRSFLRRDHGADMAVVGRGLLFQLLRTLSGMPMQSVIVV